jgi:hypothetical protein
VPFVVPMWGRPIRKGVLAVDARTIRSAVDTTVRSGTAFFTMDLETRPSGVRMRSQGVCDFANRRAATRTLMDPLPGAPTNSLPDVFQLADGGVVYSQLGSGPGDAEEQWHVVDVGGWVAAGPLSVLGWLYGVTEMHAGDEEAAHLVAMSARLAVDACPAALQDDLRAVFFTTGQLETVATGRVRLDDGHRIAEFVLDIPQGGEGPDGTVHDAARIALVLTDFGAPAMIRPPGSGPAVPVGEYIEYVLRLAGESEQ